MLTRKAGLTALAAVTLTGVAMMPAQASSPTKVWTCAKAATKPARMNIWCYHASLWAEDLRYSQWSPRRATATGNYVINTCDISCAEGPYDKYPARLSFSRPRTVTPLQGNQTSLGSTQPLFTRLRVTFLGPTPASWTGQPYMLVKESNPGTSACELVWRQRGAAISRC